MHRYDGGLISRGRFENFERLFAIKFHLYATSGIARERLIPVSLQVIPRIHMDLPASGTFHSNH
jgi:hypothetical protein